MPKAVTACTSTSATNGPTSLHPARADRAAGQRGEHAEQQAGEHAAAAAAQGALLPAVRSGGGAAPASAASAATSGGTAISARRPGRASAGVGQRGEQREQRQRRRARPRVGRDERAGADREAGAEQVGAGEDHGVGHQRRDDDQLRRVGSPASVCSWDSTLSRGAEVERPARRGRPRSDDQRGSSRSDLAARGRERRATDARQDRRPRSRPGRSRSRSPGRRRPGRAGQRPEHHARGDGRGRRRSRPARPVTTGDDDVAGGEEQRSPPGRSSPARRRRSGRRPGRARRPSRPRRWPIRHTAQAQTSGEPEGHDGDQRRRRRDAGAVGHQPGQRAHPQPVAGRPVGAGVGEEPADHAERPGRPAGCRPPRRHRRAAASRTSGRRWRRSRWSSPADGRVRSGSSEVMSAHHRGRGHGVRRCHADPGESARMVRAVATVDGHATYRGRAMRGVQKTSTRSTRTPASACSSRPTRSPVTCPPPSARCATRSSCAWHHWRKVSRLEDPEG